MFLIQACGEGACSENNLSSVLLKHYIQL
jgi:hypothetical protein